MKILVFTDVHGNLDCLEKLKNIEDFSSYDRIFHLGDAIIDYSRPNEVVEFLNKYTTPIIGNNDSYVVNSCPGKHFSKKKLERLDLMRSIITKENMDIIRGWKKEELIEVEGIKLYFCHFPWSSEFDTFGWDEIPSAASRKELFKNIDADYFFFGHEHEQNHFFDGEKHYYCCSSLGLMNPSRYLVIDVNQKEVNVEERKFFHDFDKENRKMYDLCKFRNLD